MGAQMKPTVLVVDDEALVIESLRRQLQRDFNVISSTEPSESLATGGGYDVVIADYYMPKMNGVEFLAQVRLAQPWVRRVLLTGGTAFEIALQAVDVAHVDRILVKPVTTKHLTETLHGLLVSRLRPTSESFRAETRSVLVVDDSEQSCDATQFALQEAGFRVLTARDPREVASLARLELPDIILLEANILTLDPARMIEVLRKGQLPPTTRVLLYASLPREELEAAARSCGADGCLQKGGADFLHDLEHALARVS